jgi:hypothetical protein
MPLRRGVWPLLLRGDQRFLREGQLHGLQNSIECLNSQFRMQIRFQMEQRPVGLFFHGLADSFGLGRPSGHSFPDPVRSQLLALATILLDPSLPGRSDSKS